MKSCENCPHLKRKDFDGIPFWRCDCPKEPKAESTGQRGRPRIQSQAAVQWLKEYLKDGPKPAGNKNKPEPETLFGDAIAAGYKCGTVWNAAEQIGVRKEKVEKRWFWRLPEEDERLSTMESERLQ